MAAKKPIPERISEEEVVEYLQTRFPEWSWQNVVRSTSGNILAEDHHHTVEVTVQNNLKLASLIENALATVKRQVQQKFRVELKDSANPDFLHETYSGAYTVAAEDLIGNKRNSDPKAKASKELQRAKERGASKEDLIALIANMFGDDDE